MQTRAAMVKILKSQIATKRFLRIDYRAGFSEFSSQRSAVLTRVAMAVALKLRFLGISLYKFKLRFWFNLNLYRGI